MFNYGQHAASLDDEFEFIRPKVAAPLPYSQSPNLRYHHNIYNQASQPPHLENSSFQSNLSLNETISKSVMFGIPRNNCPRPSDSRPSIGVDFHPANIGSPFVDITLNNCDDLSLYQPLNHHLRHSYPQTHSKPSPSNFTVKPEICPSPVQRTSSQIETPKPILKKMPESNWNQNTHVQYNQNLYQNGSLFKIEDNLDADESDSDHEQSDSVFSPSLKDLKGNCKEWSVEQSTISQNTTSSFQYQSFMLDDLDSLSNNMSMNTRALAAKYLFKKDGNFVNNSTGESMILPKLETQNLFKLYTPKESLIEENKFLNESSSSSDNSDSDEDVWLFGKPIVDSDKKKQNKKLPKDFSDQDSDIERDVTNILDIEKLKRLPKLL